MYCTRCGKEIDYNATVCNECLAKEAAEKAAKESAATNIFDEPDGFSTAYTAPAASGENTRMRGFGAALTGVILSFVGLMFCLLGSEDESVFGLIIVGMGMLIASMILGGISIGKFVSTKREGLPVPIATLVMGIAALSEGAIFFITLLDTLAILL